MRALKIAKQITNRNFTSIEKYLLEISRIPLITTEEEVELTKRIQAGDQIALKKLVKSNLRFVVSVAKQYQHYGISLGDLINEGNMGLIKAAQRFDPSRGFKFITYGVWWIRQSILAAVAEQSRVVRLPHNQIGVLNKISRASSFLEQAYERDPSVEELSIALEMPEDEIKATMKIAPRQVSIDQPIDEDNGYCMADSLASKEPTPDLCMQKESLQKDIRRALSKLSPRDAEIITLYFGLGGHKAETLEDISQAFQCTRERIRQIKNRALRELRKSPIQQSFKNYLG